VEVKGGASSIQDLICPYIATMPAPSSFWEQFSGLVFGVKIWVLLAVGAGVVTMATFCCCWCWSRRSGRIPERNRAGLARVARRMPHSSTGSLQEPLLNAAGEDGEVFLSDDKSDDGEVFISDDRHGDASSSDTSSSDSDTSSDGGGDTAAAEAAAAEAAAAEAAAAAAAAVAKAAAKVAAKAEAKAKAKAVAKAEKRRARAEEKA
jgi:hypothetical protein